MSIRLTAAALALGLAACVQQPPEAMQAAAPPPTPPPSPPTQASPAAAPDARAAPEWWNVERVRCSDLLGAADDDRAAAAMFYYGYLAARAGIRTIDISRIDDNISKVMRQCEAAPNLTVPQAFRQALRPRRSPS